MKKLMTCIAAGLLVIGAQRVCAETGTNSAPTTAPTPGAHHAGGMTAEQRKELMKVIGLTKEDLKDLTPAERRDKIKEAAQKALADLKAKQASGSLTEKQQDDLKLLQKFLAHGHKKNAESN